MNDKPMCGCGYGVPTHPFKDMEGLVVHVLGEGSCCRMIATGELIPKDFRHEAWYNPETGKTSLVEVCTVNGYSLTVWTLRNQRGYNYNEEFGIWSLPKNRESINSLPDNT